MDGLEVRTRKSQELPACLGWFPGAHTRGLRRAPSSPPPDPKSKVTGTILPHLSSQSQANRCAQGRSRVLPLPGASADGIRRPSVGLQLQGRVPLTQLAPQVRPLTEEEGCGWAFSTECAWVLTGLGPLPGQQPESLPWQPQSFLQKEGGRGGATVERAGHPVISRQ